MMKKITYCLLMVFTLVLSLGFYVYAASDNNFAKRIVSVVYDDSWSMFDNKQDYAYANYALQNIIGFMNESDELYVVKMSNKTVYETINISNKDKKIQQIADISKWNDGANETPFESIETAVNCLKDGKDKYGSNDNIEYWLLVLTDGGFEGMPNDVQGYFNNVQSYMSDVKFESIYVFIGGQTSSTVRSVAEKMPNTTIITSSNNEDICKGLFKAAEKIYGRTSLKDNDFDKNGNEVKFKFPFPINKLIIYEQDQNIELINAKTSKGKTLTSNTTYSANKTNEPMLTSKIIEVKSNGDCIPSGDVVLSFDGNVDLSETKFQIMVDSAVTFELKVVDNGKEISSDKYNAFTVEDKPNFIATPINPYDHSIIDMTEYISKSNASYQYDGKDTALQYDTRDLNYKFYSPLHVGNNTFVAKLDLKGYFNTYSNAVNIYVSPEPIAISPSINPGEVNVVNSFTKDYEKIGMLTYEMSNMRDKANGTLEFTNIPNGIQLKVNGNTVKNNKVSLTLNEKNDIEIYRNKDYKDTDSKNINVNVTLADKAINIKDKGVQFTLNPVIRNIKLDVKNLVNDFNSLTTANAYGINLYELEPIIDGKNISKDELKQSKITFENEGDKIGFKYKLDEEHGKNVIHLFIKRPFFSFGGKSVDTTFIMITPFNETLTHQMTFNIRWSLLDTIFRLFIPLLIIIWIIGIIKKPRFDRKNHKFQVRKNGSLDYEDKISISEGLSFLVPFKAQRGYACGLSLKADSSKKKVIVLKKSIKDTMKYDGDEISMNRDLSLYEETPLENKEGRDRILYIYYDVRNNIESESSSDSRVRRRR